MIMIYNYSSKFVKKKMVSPFTNVSIFYNYLFFVRLKSRLFRIILT